MAENWMHRTLLTAAAAASVALLAACGSSTTANSIRPDSIITFGDAMSDLGQNSNGRPYSVTTTDGLQNNWTREIAYRYDLTLTAARAGGTAYAQGNARVALPDATGTNAATTPGDWTQALADWARHQPPQAITVMVGPEGGFTEAEEKAAIAAGAIGLAMGPRILRTETAGLTALATLAALWGGM